MRDRTCVGFSLATVASWPRFAGNDGPTTHGEYIHSRKCQTDPRARQEQQLYASCSVERLRFGLICVGL